MKATTTTAKKDKSSKQNAPSFPSDEAADDENGDPFKLLSIKQLQPQQAPPSASKMRTKLQNEDVVEIFCRIPSPEDFVDVMTLNVKRKY